MKGKAIIPLVLGLCIGLVAVKYGIDAVKSAKASAAKTEVIQVIQTTQDIDAGVEVTAEMLSVVETVPNAFTPKENRVESLEDIVGRVTGKPIPEGAPVLTTMLAPEGTSPGMTGFIEPGYRAVSVKIDEVSGVAYQISPGDWVDVIVVMDLDTGRRQKETIAEVILQHVKVIALGRSLTGISSEEGTKSKAAKSATLLVPEEEVPKLHLAGTRGKITLALRGMDDQINEDFVAASLSSLVRGITGQDEKSAPAQVASIEPVSLPAVVVEDVDPEHSITVYRGDPARIGFEVAMITFESVNSRKILDAGDGQRNSMASQMRARSAQRRPVKKQEVPQEERSEDRNSASGAWESE